MAIRFFIFFQTFAVLAFTVAPFAWAGECSLLFDSSKEYIAKELAAVEKSIKEQGFASQESIALMPPLLEAANTSNPLQMLAHIAAARMIGTSWVQATDFLPEFQKFKDPIELSQLFENPLYRFRATLNLPSQDAVIGNSQLKKKHVKLFQVEFFTTPISFFKRREPQVGIPDDAHLFTMVLSPQEYQTQFSGRIPPRYGHLESSFAYIRFYVRGSDVIVTEIQSDVYRQVRDRSRF